MYSAGLQRLLSASIATGTKYDFCLKYDFRSTVFEVRFRCMISVWSMFFGESICRTLPLTAGSGRNAVCGT
jgi:hypothetical protein